MYSHLAEKIFNLSFLDKIPYLEYHDVWDMVSTLRTSDGIVGKADLKQITKEYDRGGFPGGAVVENLPANAGDTGSSPGLGRSHMPRSN